MARGKRDLGKERFWRRVLREWRRSELGIRAFCAERRLSEHSFYGWRRVIAERDAARHAARAAPQPTWVPVAVVEATDGIPVNHDAEAAVDRATANAGAVATAIEIAGSDARVVRVHAGFDAVTLRRVLAVLDEASARKDGMPC